MTLGRYMREVSTWREHLTMYIYLKQQEEANLKEPDVTQWYLMQIAAEIHNSVIGRAKAKQVEEFKIPLSYKNTATAKPKEEYVRRGPWDPPGPLTKEQIADYQSKLIANRWKSRTKA